MAEGNTIGSVYVRVRPRVKDFRRDTEDKIERDLSQPIEVEVEVKPQVDKKAAEDAGKEASKIAEREAGEAKIKFSADYDGVTDAIERVKDQVKMLERQEILFTANKEGLEEALRELRDEQLPGVQVEVEWADDEQGHRAVLQKIEEIRRDKITQTVEFATDDASLAQAQREAQAALDSIEASKPIEFSYVEDGDGYRTLMDRINQLRRERVEVNIDLNVSDNELTKLERDARAKSIALRTHLDLPSAALAEGQLAAMARDRWVELKPRISKRAMAELSGAFMAIAGLNSIRTLVDTIRNIALNFDEWAVAVGTASAAIGSLVSIGTVGLGSLLSIAGDTLQVFQGIAAAPALMLSGAAVLQTWSAIWQDFDAALQGIPGVLEEMPPAAQRAVGAIESLNEEVNQAVQQNFWGEMTDEVERFADSIGPSIVRVMGNTSTVIGRTVSSMLDYTEALKDNGSLDEFTRNHTVAMDRVGKGAEVVFAALMNMGIQGSKYLPQLGEGFRDLSNDFADFMNEAVQTGQFDRWIRNSIESIKSLGQFSKATWDMLAGITRAFENVGGAGLHEMADGMERVADFVNRGDTQMKLEGLFRAAMDGAASAGTGFANLAERVWEYDEAIQMALRTTGQLAGDFMTQISKLDFDIPIRGFEDLMSGLTDFVNRARPGFQSIVDIFGRLGSIGGEVALEIAHGMNLTMGAIDGFIARIEGPLINAIHPLTRVFEDLAALGTPILFGLANSVGVLLDAFAALPAPIQNVITLLTILGRTGVGTAISGIVGQFSTMRSRVAREMVLLQRQVPQAFATAAGSVERRAQVMATRVQARMNTMRATMKGVFGASGLLGALGGGWGIAITGAVAALAAFAGASAQAEARQEELGSTLDDVTGKITRQTEVALYDELARGADTFTEKLQALDVDFDDAFSRMGFSASDLSDKLSGTAEEVETFVSGLQELEDLDARGIEAIMSGDFSGVSDAAQEVFEYLGLSNVKATEFNTIVGRINGIAGPLADRMAHIRDRTSELGPAADGAGDSFEKMVGQADGMPAHMEEAAEAVKAIGDEASTAEQRVAGLETAMRLLNGDDLGVEELMTHSIRSMETGMDQIERIAEDGGINASKAFNEAGEFDPTLGIEAVEISDAMGDITTSVVSEIEALQQQFDEGAIDESQFVEGLSNLEGKFDDTLRSVAESLGLSQSETEAFVDYWNNRVTFDPKDLELLYESGGAAEQAQADWQRLRELGIEIDESEYIASLDANGDGFVSEQERVDGMGKAFDDMYYEAAISGDEEGWERVMDNAMAEGYLFNGHTFVSVLDADGQPTEEGLQLARERGLTWDGTQFVALADVDADPALAKLAEAVNETGRIWDGEEFVSVLDSDGNPTSEALAAARALGLEWDGDQFVASLSAEGAESTREKIAGAQAVAETYEGVYQAALEADYSEEEAAEIANAALEATDFEGDYVAFLEAMQTEEGREALRTFLEGVEGIPPEAVTRLLAVGGPEAAGQAGQVSEAANDAEGTYSAVFGALGVPGAVSGANEVETASKKSDRTFNPNFQVLGITPSVSGANQVESAALKSDRTFNPLFSALGVSPTVNQSNDVYDAANQVPGLYSAVFGEQNANHVMNQAGGVQSSINNIDKNPIISFGGRILSSFSSAISNVSSRISGVLSGFRNADGSVTGSRFKPQSANLLDVNTYADGGFENHTAQIAYSKPSSPIRIWAEPETGGEAYIPLAQSKRGRSLAIWQEVGKRFGVYADGGVAGGETVDAGGDIWNVNLYGDNVGVKDLMNETKFQKRRSGRRSQ